MDRVPVVQQFRVQVAPLGGDGDDAAASPCAPKNRLTGLEDVHARDVRDLDHAQVVLPVEDCSVDGDGGRAAAADGGGSADIDLGFQGGRSIDRGLFDEYAGDIPEQLFQGGVAPFLDLPEGDGEVGEAIDARRRRPVDGRRNHGRLQGNRPEGAVVIGIQDMERVVPGSCIGVFGDREGREGFFVQVQPEAVAARPVGRLHEEMRPFRAIQSVEAESAVRAALPNIQYAGFR